MVRSFVQEDNCDERAVKANNSENAGAKLSENELYAQMRFVTIWYLIIAH